MKIEFPLTGLSIDPKDLAKHMNTVNKHRLHVCLHCFKAGIYWQGLTHDLSKYSPEEFLVSASMYQGTRSPNEGERESKGYSLAWMHHKGRNKHHFEYWTDYDPVTRKMSPVKMPLIYVIEMFCDRVAASKVYMGKDYNNGCPLAYFDKGRNTRMIHPTTSKLLEKLLTMLRDRGEEYTFEYIRELLRRAKS